MGCEEQQEESASPARLEGVADSKPVQPRPLGPRAAAGAAASRHHRRERRRPDDHRGERLRAHGEPAVARLQQEVGPQVPVDGLLAQRDEAPFVRERPDGRDAH